MTTIGSQYRGTKKYLLVQWLLIGAARERRFAYYREVAELIGVPPAGHHMARQVGQVLGEISEDEHGAGRPMLSAIAVNAAGYPGEGFFKLVHRLGLLLDETPAATAAFLAGEQKRVFDEWKPTTPTAG